MTDFKVGDRVELIKTVNSNILEGDTAVVKDVSTEDIGVFFDNPRGIYSDGSTYGDGVHCWLNPSSLKPIFDEKMIPASQVREVARRYAERHGWCSVVDAALEEMGATDDEFVEVTLTQVRMVRLRKSDLGKMKNRDELMQISNNGQRLRACFKPGETPSSASLSSFGWRIGEPVAVSSRTDDGWVDHDSTIRPREGTQVRVRPGSDAYSLHGMRIEGGSAGVVANSDGAASGRVAVRLDMGGTRQLRLADLQVQRG